MIKRFAQRFFHWFCHPDYYDEIVGDLEEMYLRNVEQGKRGAKWKYLLQVLGLFRPSLIRSISSYSLTNPAMFRSYFNISTRILLKHKFYTAINVLGLAVGMGVCLLIYQYIHFELSYDRFYAQAPNVYRVTQSVERPGENQGVRAYTTSGLGPAATASIPEIAEAVRVHPFDEGLIVINQLENVRYQENGMWYVDPNFLQLFDFPLKYGHRRSALDDPHAMVITEPTARRYFGNTNPVGKTLRVSGGVLTQDYVVTGVVDNLPANSHLQFDFLLPISFLLGNYGPYKNHDDGWDWNYFVTYVLLNERAEPAVVRQKLNQLIDNTIGSKLASANETWQMGLQPLADIHLYSNFPKDLATNHGSIQNVRFFAVIALFILLIAWVNYINLSTARAMHRAKEVGVRKTMGAFRGQLVAQFMAESMMINLLAATVSVGIAFLALPFLNQIIGKKLSWVILQYPAFWGGFFFIILTGTLLSGFYPALVLSSFKPVKVLKSIKMAATGGVSLRRALIMFQFMISVLLISGTYLVYQQIIYMKSQDLGFDTEKVLAVNGPRVMIETAKPKDVLRVMKSSFQAFKDQVLRDDAISDVSATSHIPSKGYLGNWNALKVGAPDQATRESKVVFVDTAFFSAYDLEFLAKRPFPTEYSQYQWVIINEEAVEVYGLGLPEEAIHEQLQVFGDTLGILGVVKNIHWSSLKETQEPILFTLDPYYGVFFSIKMNMEDVTESIVHIEEAYHAVYPDDPFHYFFLDDDFNRQYQADIQFGNLFTAFSALAIFIACIGLFALVSYSATLRIKEIGIRKVLGAGVGHLMLLLSREYLILLLIATGAAVPIILLGGKAWLNNYAFRIDMGIDLFMLPGLTLLIISFITVSYRTFTAARANPVESLKTE